MTGVIGYARVSSDEQAKENNSLAVQNEKIARRCADEGWELLTVVTASESARTMERDGLKKALAYCRQHRGKVKQFIVAELSRLARNAHDQAELIVTLKQMGIELVSIDDPVTDDSAVGKLVRNMIGAINQFFSDALSERTRDRMAAAARSGRYLAKAPIGYVNKNKRLQIDPQRAPLVREAFELVASGRFATIEAVRKVIITLGLTTPSGGKLTPQTFSRMLVNPLYAGWIVSGDIKVRGVHEAIVPEEIWNAVQERVAGKSAPHKKVSEDFPLRGLVKCAGCKRPLTAGWARGRNAKYPRYWCWTKGCRAVGANRDELERHFFLLLASMGPTEELLAKLPEIVAVRWRDRKERIASDASRLSKRLEELATLNRKAIKANAWRDRARRLRCAEARACRRDATGQRPDKGFGF